MAPKKKVKFAVLKRSDNGLIDGVDYVFNDDDTIDWRAMIKTDHLVPDRNKTSETDVTKLPDAKLIILLGGIKELAQIRGYTSVKYDVKCPSSEYVVATCTIDWIPNYETEGQAVTFSAIGDASPNNTTSFAKNFLGATAENRAFVRCVRSFLKINIVGKEELPGDSFPPRQTEAAETSEAGALSPPYNLLEAAMKAKNVTLKNIKKRLSDEGYEKAINELEDIPKVKVFELIERIKKI
jgi:hypothetical protein